MTAQDIKLPISEAPDFTGSVIVLKAESLDDAWAIVKGDVYYQEGVVSSARARSIYLRFVHRFRLAVG